jgi:hypothetical protein
LVPHRGQNVADAEFWFPQLGQYLVAGCIGAWFAWGAPQDGQNFVSPAITLPQYGQLTVPGSIISMAQITLSDYIRLENG